MDLVGIALIIIALAFVALVVFLILVLKKFLKQLTKRKNHLNFN